MRIEKRDDTYFLSRGITEELGLESLGVRGRRVRFDLSGITLINSTGVRAWMKALQELELEVTYVNCSQVVVEQANMVRGFLGNKAYVESVLLPCFDPVFRKEVMVSLKEGVNYWQGSRTPPKLDGAIPEGTSYELEVDLETYLFFLQELEKP